jgi:hypothetical protein
MNNFEKTKVVLVEATFGSLRRKAEQILKKLSIPQYDPKFMERPDGKRTDFYDSGWTIYDEKNFKMKAGLTTKAWSDDVLIIEFKNPTHAASNTRSRVKSWFRKATNEMAGIPGVKIYTREFNNSIIIRPEPKNEDAN